MTPTDMQLFRSEYNQLILQKINYILSEKPNLKFMQALCMLDIFDASNNNLEILAAEESVETFNRIVSHKRD